MKRNYIYIFHTDLVNLSFLFVSKSQSKSDSKNDFLHPKTVSQIYINPLYQINQVYFSHTHLYRGTVNELENYCIFRGFKLIVLSCVKKFKGHF